jgi:ABC-2 type transport system ATP-binding protein
MALDRQGEEIRGPSRLTACASGIRRMRITISPTRVTNARLDERFAGGTFAGNEALMVNPMLSIRGLTRRYGEFTALHPLDLDIKRGEIFGLLGPNGAGKTTTMRLLMGILRPSGGTARIDGLDCFVERVEVKRRVGFVPDDPVFPDYLRGIEIVRFVGAMHGLSRGDIEVRAWPLVDRLALDGASDEYAVNYSRGMKKKLALVCALLHGPQVLILDEPTSGLDPLATRELHKMLIEMVRYGTTVLLSSHWLDEVERLCHRVAILKAGRLVAAGSLEELRHGSGPEASLEQIFLDVAGGETSTKGSIYT